MSAKRRERPAQRPPRTGVASVLTLTTLVAAVAVAGAVLTTVAFESFDRTNRLREQSRTEAQALAGSIRHQINARARSLASVAANPMVANAMASGDSARLDELERLYKVAFPDAAAVLLPRRGELRARPNGDPPIGYALAGLVDEFTGDLTMEVHRPGQNDARLNMIASVRDGGAVVGHVVALYPASVITRDLTTQASHPWELVQNHEGGSSVIARSGNLSGGGTAINAGVPDTPWQVRMAPLPTTGPFAAAPPPRIAIIVAGSVAIIMLLAWLGGRRLQQAIRHDGEQFRALVVDAAQAAPYRDYPAASPELEDWLQRAIREAQEVISERNAEDATLPQPPSSGTSAPELDATEPEPQASAEGVEDKPQASAEPAGDEPLEFDISPADDADEAPATIDPSILRAYDIRGIVGETLTAPVMRALGQALGSEAADRDQTKVVVGYDGRHSSPELAGALIEGLVRAGREVIDIGAVPTPILYFATHYLETQAGIMVTGSHNPSAYNGLKMVIGGETLSGDAIQALGGRLEAGNLVQGEGSHVHRDISGAYLEQVTRDIELARPLRVVMDCGNGIAGATAPEVIERLGCEVIRLFCDVDGDFPNHHPDPSVPSNLDDLIVMVRESGADLGVAFDGDADRLGVVDDNGKIIWADRQLMLFARDVLFQRPGSDVVFDVKCTNRLPELITENAGIPVMWKTGHSLIKGKLRETGAPLAGEMSGHFFFNDRWYGFDDGIYAAARLLEILATDPRAPSAVFADLPEGLTTPELRLDLGEGESPEIIEALVAGAETMGATRINTIDGLRVDFPDGWGLVRASNTQPCLVLRFEGDDPAALERIQGLFRERLNSLRPGIELPF